MIATAIAAAGVCLAATTVTTIAAPRRRRRRALTVTRAATRAVLPCPVTGPYMFGGWCRYTEQQTTCLVTSFAHAIRGSYVSIGICRYVVQVVGVGVIGCLGCWGVGVLGLLGVLCA